MQAVKCLAVQQGQLQMLSHYCATADPQSNTCPYVEICLACKTNNHNLLYICPLLRNTKGQEKDCRGCKSELAFGSESCLMTLF